MSESKSSRPGLIMIVVCAASAAVGSVVASSAIRSFMGPQATASVDAQLAEVASRLNSTLPMMVNEVTRLDTTAALPGKKLLYKYTIVSGAPITDPTAFVESMRPKLVNNYKTASDMSTHREARVTLVYQYFDNEGREIALIEITPEQVR